MCSVYQFVRVFNVFTNFCWLQHTVFYVFTTCHENWFCCIFPNVAKWQQAADSNLRLSK